LRVAGARRARTARAHVATALRVHRAGIAIRIAAAAVGAIGGAALARLRTTSLIELAASSPSKAQAATALGRRRGGGTCGVAAGAVGAIGGAAFAGLSANTLVEDAAGTTREAETGTAFGCGRRGNAATVAAGAAGAIGGAALAGHRAAPTGGGTLRGDRWRSHQPPDERGHEPVRHAMHPISPSHEVIDSTPHLGSQ